MLSNPVQSSVRTQQRDLRAVGVFDLDTLLLLFAGLLMTLLVGIFLSTHRLENDHRQTNWVAAADNTHEINIKPVLTNQEIVPIDFPVELTNQRWWWQTSTQDEQIIANSADTTLELKIDTDGQTSISTNCNHWQYLANYDKKRISFDLVGATTSICSDEHLQRQIAQITDYLIGSNQLKLFNANGLVMTFVALAN